MNANNIIDWGKQASMEPHHQAMAPSQPIRHRDTTAARRDETLKISTSTASLFPSALLTRDLQAVLGVLSLKDLITTRRFKIWSLEKTEVKVLGDPFLISFFLSFFLSFICLTGPWATC